MMHIEAFKKDLAWAKYKWLQANNNKTSFILVTNQVFKILYALLCHP